MAKPRKKHGILRRIFRWCRIVVWLVLLVVLIAGLYLHNVGLPSFLKKPLLDKLRARGVAADFSRTRLRWYRGIVMENATFTFLKAKQPPRFFADEAEINLHWLGASLLEPSFLSVKNGTFVWPVSPTNRVELVVSNVVAHVELQSKEKIVVHDFQGESFGARLKIKGAITNLSALKTWKVFQKKPPGQTERLEKFVGELQKIRFAATPELSVTLDGDGADWQSWRGSLRFLAAETETPWGNGKNLQLTAALRDLLIDPKKNSIHLKIDSVETRWGSGSQIDAVLNLVSATENNAAFETALNVSAQDFKTKWAAGENLQGSVQTAQALTNLVPRNLRGKFSLNDAETKEGTAGSAEIIFEAQTNTSAKTSDASWGAWSKAEPFLFNWTGVFTRVQTPKIFLEKLSLAGAWHAPELQISDLQAELYDGGLQATGKLNIATREASLQGSADFDAQQIKSLLTPYGQDWLEKFTWEKPPKLNGSLTAVLPSWTNRAPNWREEVFPSMMLNARVESGPATYRDIPVNAASTDLSLSNRVWILPNLHVVRPEGNTEAQLVADDRARTFHWKVDSSFSPSLLRPWLNEKAQKVFDDFQFSDGPPKISGDVLGSWDSAESVSFAGDVTARQFSFRSNLVENLRGSLVFSNQNLLAENIHVEHDGHFVNAQKFEFDLPSKKIRITQAVGNIDPYLITRLIGSKVAEHIEPYRFIDPPMVRVNGSLTAGKIEDADLHFLVDGGEFHWTNFVMDKISGQVDWVGETLLLTNMEAFAYQGGRGTGWAYFDFKPEPGTDFRLSVSFADVNLQAAVRSFAHKTNQLDGLLNGDLSLDSGNTANLKSLHGQGRATLRDGLIWDVPVFGIFSPLLNAVVPGSGNSRAREASANFVVNDGVVYSDDLQIRSATVRMQYRGGVDFQEQVDARVEAEFLRDLWVVGPVISTILKPLSKIFEYKVTGSLAKPVSEPVYIPDFLMMTLRPFHSIKKALEEDEKTNAPPAVALPEKP
ncbi:MAG: AsmA-like C-terminal region-containing protein [Verrucomicrobiota bacterium]